MKIDRTIEKYLNTNEMKIVCAWCKSNMGEKEPKEDDSITHSICPACRKKLLKKD